MDPKELKIKPKPIDTGGAPAIQITITPQVFCDVWLRKDFAARILEYVPEEYIPCNYGYDIQNNLFYFNYRLKDAPEGCKVKQFYPTYQSLNLLFETKEEQEHREKMEALNLQ